MEQTIEFFSLVLSLPTIALSIAVVVHYSPKAIHLYKQDEKNQPLFLLVAGIAIGFIGGALDNIYWYIAWISSYLNLDCKDALFKYGALPNIPFRQIAGAIAAQFHLAAAFKSAKSKRKFYLTLSIATMIGAIVLYLLR